MSGVLVPDDEEMINDAPQSPPPASIEVPPPELLHLHMTAIGVLLVATTVIAMMTAVLWRHYLPDLKRMHAINRAGSEPPESPNVRELRRRLDRKATKKA